jgi:hypothetical protein
MDWVQFSSINITANTVRSDNGTFNNADIVTLNSRPVTEIILPPIVANSVLRTTATDIEWGNIPAGTARQLLQTNTAGTDSEWTSDINVNTITANGNTVLEATRVNDILDLSTSIGIMALGGNPGSAGQQLYSGGVGNPPYWAGSASEANYTAKYFDNDPVNMNTSANTRLFGTSGVAINSSNILYESGTGPDSGFTIVQAGTYSITIETLASTASACTQVNLLLNNGYVGSTRSIYTPGNTNSQPFLMKKYLAVAAYDILTIESEPVVLGAINTSGPDNHGIPTTTITFELVKF